MSSQLAVLQNMEDLGFITHKDGDIVSASIVSNDGNYIIEAERRTSDMYSHWMNTPNDPYYSARITIRFKDTLTNTTRLEIVSTPNAIASMIDTVESWVSFNGSYDCIAATGYTDIMGNTFDFSFSAENINGKSLLPGSFNEYPYIYNLIVLQYNPVTETVMQRMKIELERVEEYEMQDNHPTPIIKRCTLYDFLDILFYVAFSGSNIYETDWIL